MRATSCASFTIASCFDWGGLIFYFVDKYVKILSGKGGTKILISPIDKTTSSRLLPYLCDCISTEQTEKPYRLRHWWAKKTIIQSQIHYQISSITPTKPRQHKFLFLNMQIVAGKWQIDRSRCTVGSDNFGVIA